MQLGGLPSATGAHPLGWCALRPERAVGWHLILRPKFLYTPDVFLKACKEDKIWAPECIAEKVKFAFCSASIVSRECSIGSIFAFSVEKFSSVACFPDNNLGLHFVYYRHFCLHFQSHVLLQAHWRMLHPHYRKVKRLSTSDHYLCCQWGCLH